MATYAEMCNIEVITVVEDIIIEKIKLFNLLLNN